MVRGIQVEERCVELPRPQTEVNSPKILRKPGQGVVVASSFASLRGIFTACIKLIPNPQNGSRDDVGAGFHFFSTGGPILNLDALRRSHQSRRKSTSLTSTDARNRFPHHGRDFRSISSTGASDSCSPAIFPIARSRFWKSGFAALIEK